MDMTQNFGSIGHHYCGLICFLQSCTDILISDQKHVVRGTKSCRIIDGSQDRVFNDHGKEGRELITLHANGILRIRTNNKILHDDVVDMMIEMMWLP